MKSYRIEHASVCVCRWHSLNSTNNWRSLFCGLPLRTRELISTVIVNVEFARDSQMMIREAEYSLYYRGQIYSDMITFRTFRCSKRVEREKSAEVIL